MMPVKLVVLAGVEHLQWGFKQGWGNSPTLKKEEKMSNEIRFLTINQVCKELQIARVTFWKLRKSGFLPPTFYLAKRPRWSIDCLEELLKLKAKEGV